MRQQQLFELRHAGPADNDSIDAHVFFTGPGINKDLGRRQWAFNVIKRFEMAQFTVGRKLELDRCTAHDGDRENHGYRKGQPP